MDLRHMRYFVTVVDERSFTRAAEKLHIAQPPLSRTIQQLEEEIGAQLIDREHRPLRLTEAGQLFLEQATQILRRFDDLRVVMGRASQPTSSRFTIGFVASTMYAALPDLIRRFRALTPGLDLQFVESTSVQQIVALKEKRIDVGFGRLRRDDPEIRRDVLREERLVVALPVGHALAKVDGSLSLAGIAAEPLIVYPSAPRPSYADQVISIYRDRGLEPVIAYEARELQTAIGLVAAEMGLCIVPTSVQRLRRDDVVYRRLDEEGITSPIIMSRRLDDDSRELKVLSRVIIDAYRQWGWSPPEGLDR
jgi:DNA-binding transcriptional LysR family regulator